MSGGSSGCFGRCLGLKLSCQCSQEGPLLGRAEVGIEVEGWEVGTDSDFPLLGTVKICGAFQ